MKLFFRLGTLLLVYFTLYQSAFCQNQLTFASVFNKTISYNHPPMGSAVYSQYYDSIIVPQGYVLKIESTSLLERYTSLPNGSSGSYTNTSKILSVLMNNANLSDNGITWFQSGTHPIIISTASSGGFGVLVNINGLLFKVDP